MKKEFKKMRRGLGTSGITFNVLISESWGAPEGEQEQDVENLFEKNNEE